MPCLFVCEPFTQERREAKNVDLSAPITEFKDVVKELTQINAEDQELLFYGKCLNNEQKSLESYGVVENVTIFVTKKPQPVPRETASTTLLADEVTKLLTTARSPAYRQFIRKFMKNNEAVEKLINETEVLKNEPTCVALLRDSALFSSVVDTAKPESLVSHFPTFGFAIKKIIAACRDNPPSATSSTENEDAELYDDPVGLLGNDVLATEDAPQGQRPAQISASDLANALSFATMNNSQGSATTAEQQTLSPEQMDGALEQMRALGIHDETLGRRALTMTGGNVEAAVNLIFEGALQ